MCMRSTLLATLALALPAAAQADEPANYFKVSGARTTFDNRGTMLSGPAGTTPPGIGADAQKRTTVGLAYGRRLDANWSAELAVGIPPSVSVAATGSGAALGKVGSFKALIPAVVFAYSFDGLSPHVQPYIGAGINYTHFADRKVTPAYNAAFGGGATDVKLTSSWGGVVKAGLAVPLGQRWQLDLSWQRYRVRTHATLTTATAGVGAIARTLDKTVDPTLCAVGLVYRF